MLECCTDSHDGVERLLPGRSGALTGRAVLHRSGGEISVSESHWSRDDIIIIIYIIYIYIIIMILIII